MRPLVPIASAGASLKLIYTIRADFTSRLFSHRRFIDEIQDSDVKIGPMTHGELESVIQKPASRENVTFEEGLTERILNDAGADQEHCPSSSSRSQSCGPVKVNVGSPIRSMSGLVNYRAQLRTARRKFTEAYQRLNKKRPGTFLQGWYG